MNGPKASQEKNLNPLSSGIIYTRDTLGEENWFHSEYPKRKREGWKTPKYALSLLIGM